MKSTEEIKSLAQGNPDLCTKKTSLEETEWAGRHSPIWNKIEKCILFVSCHRNSGKKETAVMYSDLDSWNMAWVESSFQVLPQIPPATRTFLTWNEIACFIIHFLQSVNCFLLFYEPPMPGTYSILNKYLLNVSVQFSCSVVSSSLQPHESQHARPPCPSPTPGVYSNSCPSSWWCHPAISSSVVPFFSCPQSLQHQSLFQWVNSSREVAKVLEFQL